MTGPLLARWREVLVGVALGVIGWATALLFPPGWRVILEGALVAWIGAIYVGFGLLAPERRSAVIEILVALGMLMAAVFGIAWWPWILTMALVFHAGWDAAHHDGRITASVPRWYPSFCAAADLVLAGLFGALHRPI